MINDLRIKLIEIFFHFILMIIYDLNKNGDPLNSISESIITISYLGLNIGSNLVK